MKGKPDICFNEVRDELWVRVYDYQANALLQQMTTKAEEATHITQPSEMQKHNNQPPTIRAYCLWSIYLFILYQWIKTLIRRQRIRKSFYCSWSGVLECVLVKAVIWGDIFCMCSFLTFFFLIHILKKSYVNLKAMVCLFAYV